MKKHKFKLKLLSLLFIYSQSATVPPSISTSTQSQLVPLEHTENLLFVNTLDGNLHCLNANTGDKYWSKEYLHPLKIYGEPIADKHTFQFEGLIIPNPENGTIFILDKNSTDYDYEIKAPKFTVQNLVEKCPFSCADAIFQGQKKDSWLEIDFKNGKEVLRDMLVCFIDIKIYNNLKIKNHSLTNI